MNVDGNRLNTKKLQAIWEQDRMEIETSSLHQDTATLTVERYMVEEEMAAIGQEHERRLIALLVAPPASASVLTAGVRCTATIVRREIPFAPYQNKLL